MENKYERLEHCIHYRFSQVKLLAGALTHSSYANERPDVGEDNERLEFLGDAVLELVVSEELFKKFPDVPEGHLTRLRSKLVKEQTLADVAKSIELDLYILLGKGEESQGGRERDSLLADAFEAILGAVFLDGGFEVAKVVLLRLFKDRWPESPDIPKAKDYKSRLQELTQSLWRERPLYTLADTTGPEHEKVFTVTVRIPDGREFTASGGSVKKAEQKSAGKAIAHYRKEYPENF